MRHPGVSRRWRVAQLDGRMMIHAVAQRLGIRLAGEAEAGHDYGQNDEDPAGGREEAKGGTHGDYPPRMVSCRGDAEEGGVGRPQGKEYPHPVSISFGVRPP